MAAVGPEDGGIDIEGAAGDQQAVEARDITLGQVRFMRQQHRQAAGAHHGGAVVLPERIEGHRRGRLRGRLRLLFDVEGEADNRALRHGRSFGMADRAAQPAAAPSHTGRLTAANPPGRVQP